MKPLKLTEKQWIKARTNTLALKLYKGLLSPEEAEEFTLADLKDNFPKVTKSKNHDTGVITLGLSIRGIKKLVKKQPYISVQEVAQHFGLTVST